MRNRSRRNSSLNQSGSSERQPNGAEGRLSSAALEGLRSESSSVWFDRGAYERAESLYYVRLLQEPNGTTSPASCSDSSRKPETCRHRGQEACHHVVEDVWVNKPNFDQAESKFVGRSPNQPRSLQLQPNSQTCSDEGYQSQTPTPPTPASKPINGLPCLTPPPMGVWLQKPLFDRAEASFYQNLYCRNSTPKTSRDESSSKRRNNDVATLKKPVFCDRQGSDDVRTNRGAATCYFLHPDSEGVWLDRGRYVEAETRFYEGAAAKSLKTSVNRSSRKKKMTAADCLAQERIWFEKPRYDEAERRFYEQMNGLTQHKQDTGANSILQDIARARENIQKSLAGSGGGSAADYGELAARIKNLELENQSLHTVVEDLRLALGRMESRVSALEKRSSAPTVNGTGPQKASSAPLKEEEDEEEDDIDLFGSDEEVDEEAERLKEQRLQEYAAKKAKKPVLIAKSSILLDVKPWDDETDMKKLEECVRSVQVDGLLWGASKLVPVGYGIKKLQINCVVEDDKVGTDFLEEEITKFEDYVQSVDVAAFNKI
ncbi:eukaryotic translation elongation factor 1 delta b (guanine nucleotide exchange protein) isoform X2 [Pimephales promelas]|uniref:eukaryotic translation elongation factor 1 delta b (guanine nucleotide exchange protein) isoform X2 n=2 Tax=Pimephales promelas TaxID=90988 RepID=UPI0019558C7A|nr:eukaryotic translation elongation factor 1 delta b (guanine nucleotide exchange protein) isoform X2 [Pimephales promelas]KAG1941848.1 elongation factor 1-delta [Pimephales promelas]